VNLAALVPIAVAIFNAVGPSIMSFLQQAFAHPALDDNGKAALAALRPELRQDVADVDALQPLPVPDEKPTPPPAPTRPD
jgi:hypothetical protein